MVRKYFAIILCVVLINQHVRGEEVEKFRIGAGDILNISISLQGSLRDLSKITLFLPIQIVGESVYSTFQVTVGPDGFISVPSLEFPLQVGGLTLLEVENLIAFKLRLPSIGKSVSVSLAKVDSQPFFVWGAVTRPGRFVLDRPMSLMEGISLAGGPTLQAQLKKVAFLRTGEKPLVLNLTDKHLMKEGAPNIFLRPSDTILVPKKWTADMTTWFLILTIIGTAATVAIATQ